VPQGRPGGNFEPPVGATQDSDDMNRQSGFTLLELMTTLAIAGVLGMLAVSGYSSLVLSNRLSTNTNEFIADVSTARSEAIKRNAVTTICKSTNGTSCATTGSWTDGWIVLVDSNSDGVVDEVVRVHQALPGNNTFTTAANAISYDRHAILSAGSGNYVLCSPKLGKSRTVEIGITGRTTVQSGTC